MINDFKKIYELKKWFPVFVINMVAGVFAYSLLMTHQLVNQYDGMWHGSVSYANGHELSNGRWFWRFLDRGRNFLSPDPVTSIIALFFFILMTVYAQIAFACRNQVKGNDKPKQNKHGSNEDYIYFYILIFHIKSSFLFYSTFKSLSFR